MSFLEGLAAFGGGFAEEAQAVKKQQSDQALKEQMIQLREGQLALMMQKTAQGQGKAAAAAESAPMTADLESAAAASGTTPIDSTDPTALPFATPAATGGPPGGPTGQASAPPYAPPAASGGAAPAATAPAAISQALQQGQRPASQPPGAAGAGMPTPQPQAGQPAAQLQQMPQGQQGPPGAQPRVPPGPQGQPSFGPGFQGASQPLQAKPVQLQRIAPSLGPGAPQGPIPGQDETFRPGQPKGKRLFDQATPEQQAQAGITQPQQKGAQVAQAGEPGQWKPGQPVTPANAMSRLRQKYPGRPEAEYAKAFKDALPTMLRMEQAKALAVHRKTEEGMQAERAEAAKQAAATKKEEKERHHQDVQYYVKGIRDNLLPPSIIGTRGDKVEIGGELVKEGVNLSEKQNQWLAAQLDLKAMNAPRARQTFAYARSVQQTLKRTLDAAKKLDLGGFVDYNRAKLEAYGRTAGNSEEGQLIRKYFTDINTLKAEFSQLENAGYAPTESVWHLAKDQINENWGFGALRASLQEISELIDIRVNAFKHPLSETQQDNPYMPSRQQDQQQQPAGNDPLGIR